MKIWKICLISLGVFLLIGIIMTFVYSPVGEFLCLSCGNYLVHMAIYEIGIFIGKLFHKSEKDSIAVSFAINILCLIGAIVIKNIPGIVAFIPTLAIFIYSRYKKEV